MKKIKIGFCGLSHLGICYSIAAACKGYNVIGFDENKKIIENLNKQILPLYEPDLQKNLKKIKKKITFSNNINELKSCNIVFISKDVPTLLSGKSDTDIIKKLINKTTKVLNKNTILVILSQVLPGFTEKINWNKKLLYYQAETLIFGRGFSRALKPDRLIIGTSTNKISNIYYRYLSSFKCKIIKLDYVSAELSKISINIYLIFSITYANSMSETAEKIGANWGNIIDVLKSDKRIGQSAYISPGFGIGGSNLKRDIVNLISIIKPDKKKYNFYKNIISLSDKRIDWLNNKFKKSYKKNSKVSILGVTYKENTNSIKNSPAVELIKSFPNNKFYYYDPVVKNLGKKFKNIKLLGLKEILKNSNILILLSPWSEFYKISSKYILNNKKLFAVIDPYGVLKNKITKKFKYYSFAVNNDGK